MHDYRYYGYRLRSEVSLPMLPAVPPRGGDPEISLRLGTVGEHLESTVWSSAFLEISGEGEALAKISDRLRFRIARGSDIVLHADASPDPGEVETHLTSLVAGLVMHQRQVLPLHASAVALDGAAVAFAGSSGIGKSTLASALALQGCPLIADDVCRIQFNDGVPLVAPGPPRLRLWPDMAQALGQAPESLMKARTHHPKRVLTDVATQTGLLPLRVLVRLAISAQASEPRLERLSGPASVMPMDDLVYRTRLARRMGRQVEIFQQLTELGAAVRVYRLTRPEGPPDLARLIDLVRQAAGKA